MKKKQSVTWYFFYLKLYCELITETNNVFTLHAHLNLTVFNRHRLFFTYKLVSNLRFGFFITWDNLRCIMTVIRVIMYVWGEVLKTWGVRLLFKISSVTVRIFVSTKTVKHLKSNKNVTFGRTTPRWSCNFYWNLVVCHSHM